MSALEIRLDNDLSNIFHIEQNGLSVGHIELKWTGTQATITKTPDVLTSSVRRADRGQDLCACCT
jgi:hypothetical protein